MYNERNTIIPHAHTIFKLDASKSSLSFSPLELVCDVKIWKIHLHHQKGNILYQITSFETCCIASTVIFSHIKFINTTNAIILPHIGFLYCAGGREFEMTCKWTDILAFRRGEASFILFFRGIFFYNFKCK